MNRRLASAMLVAVGVLLGFAVSSYQRGEMGPPAARAADVEGPQDRDVVAHKEVNAQLKDINALLHSSTAST